METVTLENKIYMGCSSCALTTRCNRINHFINTHMACNGNTEDQMASSGWRGNEMGACSLATNYLACMDYTKYLQNHRTHFQNEILALCLETLFPAWAEGLFYWTLVGRAVLVVVGGENYCTSAQTCLHTGITWRGLKKAPTTNIWDSFLEMLI